MSAKLKAKPKVIEVVFAEITLYRVQLDEDENEKIGKTLLDDKVWRAMKKHPTCKKVSAAAAGEGSPFSAKFRYVTSRRI